VRDQPIGVLATGPMAVHQALLFRQLSTDVIVFAHTGPELAAEDAAQLDALGVRVVPGEVAALEVTDDRLTGVRLTSGEVVPRAAVVVAPRFTARSEVLASLGLSADEQVVAGHVVGSAVAGDPTGATAVPGVWVAGNVADMSAQVVVSAAAGLRAGAMINADLVAEEARDAVAARRAAAA
jgi:thioredoxin reductase (NADPH)